MNPADLTGGSALYIIGDVRNVLATVPDGSIDLIVTSPPFLALRSYLPADHPDKHREIGSEPTPADFLDTLLGLTAEWRRVLAPHGSIAIELGDTYSGSGGAGGDYGEGGWRAGQPTFGQHHPGAMPESKRWTGVRTGWPLDKSLTGIPTLYASSLAYGRNLLREPFTAVELLQWIDGLRASGYSADAALAAAGGWVAEHGEPQRFPRWRIRNQIPWVRPNPPVGALGDKCRPATSYITVATLARDRWWDMEDCRTERLEPSVQTPSPKALAAERLGHHGKGMPSAGDWHANGGAPLLDWWQIPTAPYPGAHYATFPPELPARLTKLMCPRQVCRQCGHPRRRLLGEPTYVGSEKDGARADGIIMRGGQSVAGTTVGSNANLTRVAETLGWSDCGHNDYRSGVVLDPFAGTGTTLAAATGLGRAAIGIDLDDRNVDLARQRCGMFLEVAA